MNTKEQLRRRATRMLSDDRKHSIAALAWAFEQEIGVIREAIEPNGFSEREIALSFMAEGVM